MILTIVSMLVALVLTLLSGIVYIDFLKKKMYNQYILEYAPENHAKKAGTPTTGGVFIVFSIIVASIISLMMEQKMTTSATIVLLSLVFFTLTGFKDDFQKIKKQENKGLTPRGKLFFQVAISILPVLYMTLTGHTELTFGAFSINLGYFYPIFAIFLITGVSNAVNLTDGLDGLAAANSSVAMLTCALFCIKTGHIDLAIIAAASVGACIGFLYFNRHPAKVFMGDTGSLALGGMLGTLAVMGKFELWLIFIGIIFLCETLSVIIQVTSFKLTGKRVFKMTPIHHHFELCNWSETKIVIFFTLISILFCVLAIQLFRILYVG